MILAPTLHVALLAISGVTTALLAGAAWRHRTRLGAIPFGGLMVGFTLYSGAHLVGLLTLDPVWRLIWERVQWTGTAIIPLCWLLFGLEYTGYDELLTRPALGALVTPALVTIALVWTNPYHGLVWAAPTIVVTNGLAVLDQPFGPWAIAFTGLAYGMLAVGSFLILRLVWLSDRLYASQALLLVVGIVVALGANVLTLLGLTPIRNPPLDISPYAFAVTGVAFGAALFRHRLFELVPAAHHLGRNAAIRDLEDGVLIVDTDEHVIYCNEAAAELFETTPQAVLGEPVRMLVDDDALDFAVDDSLAAFDHDGRSYEVRTSPIRGRRDRLIGYTLIVQDITARTRREQRLVRQRDELARLDRLNAVIRSVNQALLSATSRAEIERAVCDQLAEPELYRVACIADVPTWSGDADRWTVATADGDPTSPEELFTTALDIEAEPSAPVVETTDDRDDVWTVVPVRHGRTVYGALALRPGGTETELPLGDRERDVLAELGGLIGQAINAVAHRQLLAAESVVEVTLDCADEQAALVAAATETGATLRVPGLVPNGGAGPVAYVTVEGGDTDAVAAALAGDGPASARVIRSTESDGGDTPTGLVEWTVPPETPLAVIVDHGAKVESLTVTDGTARLTAEVASEADVRALLERVQQTAPDTRLATLHERDRPVDRAERVPDTAVAELTDRQQEALEAAYRAGYYEWPRASTGEEIADTLDIAAPTLHAHLRKAEHTLLAELFDRDRSVGD